MFRSSHLFGLHAGFASHAPTWLSPGFPFPALLYLPCPHSSDPLQYRNLNLLSIGYAFPPRLRPRLTRGRSALPRKPWIFGLKDSHFNLATHSGILSSCSSTAPYSTASSVTRMLLYQTLYPSDRRFPQLRCCVLAPDIFGAGPLD